MTTRLPLLEAREAETRLCTYCPKLCRPACPVSTVEGRETVTPWGKMRAMGEIERGVAPPDRERFAPAYACTGCLRCVEMCDLDNPASDTLRDARGEAMRQGAANEHAVAFVRAFGAREARLAGAAEDLPRGAGRVALLPGCTNVTFDPGRVGALADAVTKLDAPCGVVAGLCCGAPLLDAGDRDGFVARARALAEHLRGFDRVVTPDAGCAYALRVFYPRFGVDVPPARHLAEVAAASLAAVPRLADAPAGVVYHDPCRLGRGLGVYDEPRAVLARLLGRAPGELAEKRNMAPCSGAGGILPKTSRRTADAIAGEAGALARESGGELVVTACPASKRQLERAGVRAVDLAAMLADAMGAAG